MKAITYLIAGFLFILFGILSAVKNKKKVNSCNASVEGRIVRIDENIEESDSGHKKKKSYEPVFQYTVNGKIFEKTSKISTSDKNKYKVGDLVEILYNPLQADMFIVKDESAKSGRGFCAVMFLIGLALIILGITQL